MEEILKKMDDVWKKKKMKNARTGQRNIVDDVNGGKKKTILQKIHEQGKEHMLDDVTCFICKKNIGKNRGKHLPAG